MSFGSGFGWTPESDFVLAELPTPVRRKLDLSIFPRGVDNTHIDVVLDPLLCTAISELVVVALREQLKRRELSLEGAGLQSVEAFETLHTNITQNISRFKSKASPRSNSQLYQLVLLKQILSSADRELFAMREQLEATVNQDHTGITGGTTQAHDQLVFLGRNHKTLRYKIVRRILQIQRKVEHRGLRKIRKSMLGISWPAPEELLFNPLVQLGGLGCEMEFLKLYPFLLIDSQTFQETNNIICNMLADWLPAYTSTPPLNADSDLSSLSIRKDSGDLPGYAELERFMRESLATDEFKRDHLSWLDDPENFEMLLGGKGDDWPDVGPWHNKYWPTFQKNLLSKLENTFSKSGLMDKMLVSQAMEPLLSGSTDKLQPLVVYQYLVGMRNKKSLLNQLQKEEDAEQFLLKCEEIKKTIKQFPSIEKQRRLVSILGGYARFRRDLKCAWHAYRTMDKIRLLEDTEDLDLSRTNGLLHTFSANVEDAEDTENEVTATVIIKADLRGSTALTATMRDSDQNPAVYFSENLFKPINQILKDFGAIKVFIEGDAIIVALLQYEHPDPDDRVVARACGLAYRMLEVIKVKNRVNRKHKLPELELGVGIAYIDEAPTYLFDEKHKITISPAINRADRLSSCASELHSHKLGSGSHGWGVEVVKQVGCGDKNDDTVLRYNVNGIELDLPAYRKLITELSLKKIKSGSLSGGTPNRYFLGRFPDVSGKMSWVVVREGPVCLWDGNKLTYDPLLGQFFYEVISDARVVSKIRKKLA